MPNLFKLTPYGTIEKTWLAPDATPPVHLDDELKSPRYRRHAALSTCAHVLEACGVNLDDVIVSCPKSDIINVEKVQVGGATKIEQVKINRFHSSAVFDFVEDMGEVWNIRLWFDVTMGKRLRHKVVTREHDLVWVQAALAASMEDWAAERLAITFLNTLHVITPIIYCTIGRKNPRSFQPRFFEMNEQERFSKAYCQLANSFGGWYVNMMR